MILPSSNSSWFIFEIDEDINFIFEIENFSSSSPSNFELSFRRKASLRAEGGRSKFRRSCVAKRRRPTTFDGRTARVHSRNGRGPDWRVASTRPTKISRHSLVAAKGAGAPDVRHPVAASRLRIFSLVSRQPPLECRARRSAPFCTRLDSNPTLPLDSSTRAPRCHGFHSDGVARVILSGEVTRNYEGETLKRLSRGGSRPRRRSNGWRHVCLYLYSFTP